jgi:hypothetical protein
LAGIREDLGALIDAHLDSVAKVEVFALLGREHREWSPDAVAVELRTSAEGASQILEELAERGLATRNSNGYVIAAALDVRNAARDLGALFANQRMSIVNRIYQPRRAAPSVDPVRAFADAFRIKKKDGDGG